MQYPDQVFRIMHSQIVNLRVAIRCHYKNRHDGRGSIAAKNWIAELRRIDRASGYSKAAKLIGKPFYRSI